MFRLLPLSLLAGLLLTTTAPAFAAPPPDDALPLSEILAMIEEREDVAYFDEIDWDDDGHWDIEYVREGGGTVEIEVDPRTGDLIGR